MNMTEIGEDDQKIDNDEHLLLNMTKNIINISTLMGEFDRKSPVNLSIAKQLQKYTHGNRNINYLFSLKNYFLAGI